LIAMLPEMVKVLNLLADLQATSFSALHEQHSPF